jgi:hypothetical protein
MARATKATAEDIGRGAALPDPAVSVFDAFIIEASANPTGEPDGLYHRRLGSWVRDAGGGGASEIGSGTALPDPLTTTLTVFVVANSLNPTGEPDGLYYRTLGSWVQP